MKIYSPKFPIDIVLCLIWSSIILAFILFNIDGVIRIIFGLPLIFFIPGYILLFALFPYIKKEKGINTIERFILSLGLSIVFFSLLGLILNYTSFGIRLEPILIILYLFITVISTVAIYRWFITKPEERYIISLDFPFKKSRNIFDKLLSIILTILIIIIVLFLVYIMTTPKIGEQFTDFYLLDSEGQTYDYPRAFTTKENSTVIIGILNHEYRTVNYTIEIWIIDQLSYYNESENINKTIINHMWFIDKIDIQLSHFPINSESNWSPQWEYNFSFNINRKGNFKLLFLLYTTQTENYEKNVDYKELAEDRINSAYRETYLWIVVI